MRAPRLPAITLEGLAFVVMLGFVLAGSLVRQINLLLALFALLAGLPLINAWLVRTSLRRLRVTRRVPRHVIAGDLLMAEFELQNRHRLPSWAVTIEDEIRRDDASTDEQPIEAQTFCAYAPAGATVTASYWGRIMRRGRYRFGPLRLVTRFPFGLVRSRVTIEQSQTILVYPRLGRLTRRWQRLRQRADVGTSNVERTQGLIEGDFYGLREWRRGDSRRWIHWRSSARRPTPVVRQFEQHRNQDLALFVELWQPPRPTPVDIENVELAISFAASIVSDLCRRGGRTLWISIAGRAPQANSGPTSLALTREVMESLAVAEATHIDTLPTALSGTLSQVRAGTNGIVISTRAIDWADTERFAQLWSNPRERAWLGRLLCINVSQAELGDYFVPL